MCALTGVLQLQQQAEETKESLSAVVVLCPRGGRRQNELPGNSLSGLRLPSFRVLQANTIARPEKHSFRLTWSCGWEWVA